MADILYSGGNDIGSFTDVAAPGAPTGYTPGTDVNTGDLRRKFNFGDRVSELALAQDPFFRFVSMVAKKPTDDPQFKYTEKRGSWHKRYAYPVGFSHDDTTYDIDGTLSNDVEAVLDTEGDQFWVKMAGDYKTAGNVQNIAGQTGTDMTIGAEGTQPNFYLPGQLIKINIASAVSGEAKDYVIAKIETVDAVAGSSTFNTSTTIEYVKLKCRVVRPTTLGAGNVFVPRLAAGGSSENQFGIASHYLAGAATVQDNAGNVTPPQVIEEIRSYVVGTTFDKGTGYPETWKDQPYSTGYGQTQIWKTSMAMDNTDRATVLKYEGDEWARIWKEKLIEHKWDIEQSLLFGTQSDTYRTTQGAVDFVLSKGNIFTLDTATKTQDDFLDDMSAYLDPRYNNSSATVFFCSTDVYNWLHKLSGYFQNNLQVSPNHTADFAVMGKKNVMGLGVTTISTVYGDMNVVRNIHLDGTKIKILGMNMKYCSYRPLVGNGINRDTSIYVGVQTLENSGVDRRVDQILTEAGMEWSMPECHAIWKV